jgi:uncharacterized membrane protein
MSRPLPRSYPGLAYLLLGGVVLSLVLMGTGYGLLAARKQLGHDAWLPLGSIVPQAMSGDPRGFLDLGVLVLLVTPTLRVVASIMLFAAERQTRRALLEVGVLVLLAASMGIALLRG